MIAKFQERNRDLGLSLLPDDESERLATLTALGTAVVMNYLHTGMYIAD